MSKKFALEKMPFVKRAATGEVESYWSVESTGSHAADNKRGAEYAVLFIEFMRRNKAHHLFANVTRDLMVYGRGPLGALNGVSIGFLHEIAKRAATS